MRCHLPPGIQRLCVIICLPVPMRPFVFSSLRIALFATPLFSHSSALPPGFSPRSRNSAPSPLWESRCGYRATQGTGCFFSLRGHGSRAIFRGFSVCNLQRIRWFQTIFSLRIRLLEHAKRATFPTSQPQGLGQKFLETAKAATTVVCPGTGREEESPIERGLSTNDESDPGFHPGHYRSRLPQRFRRSWDPRTQILKRRRVRFPECSLEIV